MHLHEKLAGNASVRGLQWPIKRKNEMAMSFDEALDSVLFLPQGKRVLIGRGKSHEDLDWSAGGIDDVDQLVRNLEPELERAILQRVADFRAAGSRSSMMISSDGHGIVTVLVLGAESPESVAELALGCAEKIAGDYAAQYIASKQDEWKRPAAAVLPFRRRIR